MILSEEVKEAWKKVRHWDLECAASAMLRGNVAASVRSRDNGGVAIVRVSFPCKSPEETARYAGDVPVIIAYVTTFQTLFERLVSVPHFRAFPYDCDRTNEFVVEVEYGVPSISAFLAGGSRRHFTKRLAIHEIANVFAESLHLSCPDIARQLRAKFPDPRRFFDSLFRRKTGFGDLARVYQAPKKTPLRNRAYFDR